MSQHPWKPSSGLPLRPRPEPGNRPQARSGSSQDQFESLNASLLYCPRCRVATPTRERLLLVLPSGNLYEYLCMQCGTSTGSKTDGPERTIQTFRP